MTDEHVELIRPFQANPLVSWNPQVGAETLRLLSASRLDDAGERMVRSEATGILARCADPSRAGCRTGLVVGYVQSGKTLSFTTVVSLARDNNIPLIVLLAGTKENLHDQTSERLSRDLAIERDGGLSPWALMTNPKASAASTVAGYIKSMTEAGIPEKFRRATVITVMKNKARLNSVQALLESLSQYGVDLATTPALLIDDEADQAGLNAAVQKPDQDATTTYQAIVDLRAAMPRHTYLMYTATPQAPLLVNLADVLSPDFVSVLTPGAGYTGGDYFFERHKSTFVRRLSASEVTAALTDTTEPPETLKLALASYYLTVAERGDGPMSMLVHPSHTRDLHRIYASFVTNMSDRWKETLQEPGGDRDDLVSGPFQRAYGDLVAGGADLKPLDELLESMPFWIGATEIRVVNSQKEADQAIKWKTAPSWILIGGNKLDRGFTVEGLTTTYMPRKLGAGQVDSVQQRARFFGYKSSYATFCRAWLNAGTADAFEHYVEHERLLREELADLDRQGVSLKRWKRRMLLDPAFKPTRRAVIDLAYFHDKIRGDRWMSFSKVPRNFLSPARTTPVEGLWMESSSHAGVDPRDQRSTGSKHRRALVPMSTFLEAVADWLDDDTLRATIHPEDVTVLNQVSLLLGARNDDSANLGVELYRMDDGHVRTRTANQAGAIDLPQGRDNKVYQGDDKFFTDGVTSVQLHRIAVDGNPAKQVLGLRLRVPSALAGGVLTQA